MLVMPEDGHASLIVRLGNQLYSSPPRRASVHIGWLLMSMKDRSRTDCIGAAYIDPIRLMPWIRALSTAAFALEPQFATASVKGIARRAAGMQVKYKFLNSALVPVLRLETAKARRQSEVLSLMSAARSSRR